MLDTHAVARALTNAEFTPAQADAITDAVRQAAEHGDQVTSDQFKTGLAELRTEMAGQRAELTGQIAEIAGQIAEQRAEVAEVRTEIANLDTRLSTQTAEVRTEIGALNTRLSTQIADLRTEQRTDIAGVRTEIASLETRLIRWMVGTVLAAVGLMDHGLPPSRDRDRRRIFRGCRLGGTDGATRRPSQARGLVETTRSAARPRAWAVGLGRRRADAFDG